MAGVEGSHAPGDMPGRGICPVIVGPTAVGKTGLITTLAEQFPIEVISLDSRQIYNGLRIGTAQPTAEEQSVCKHHLIDFLSPEAKYDAIRFRHDFEGVFKQIRQGGGIPVLVGGAGMYLTALREGFMEIPGSSAETLDAAREELNPLSDSEVRGRLEKVDPESYSAIHANDRYRSQRALEIHLISGQTRSQLKAAQKPNPCLGLDFPTFVLERPTLELDDRIAKRTELMLAEGWLKETEIALQKHPATCPGMMSIGYREIVSHLQGKLAEKSLAPAIVKVTRQYAKRQRTWFRHIPAAAKGGPLDQNFTEALVQAISLTQGLTGPSE